MQDHAQSWRLTRAAGQREQKGSYFFWAIELTLSQCRLSSIRKVRSKAIVATLAISSVNANSVQDPHTYAPRAFWHAVLYIAVNTSAQAQSQVPQHCSSVLQRAIAAAAGRVPCGEASSVPARPAIAAVTAAIWQNWTSMDGWSSRDSHSSRRGTTPTRPRHPHALSVGSSESICNSCKHAVEPPKRIGRIRAAAAASPTSGARLLLRLRDQARSFESVRSVRRCRRSPRRTQTASLEARARTVPRSTHQ